MLTRPAQPECSEASDVKRRVFAMAIREAMRLALKAWEEYYDLPRSFTTQSERRER